MSSCAGRSVKTGTQVLLEHHHHLREAADASLGEHRRAIREVGERREDVAAKRVLAVVRTAMQALITLPALRRAGHDHPIADLHALHLRPDRLDDAEAGVIGNRRALRVVGGERTARARVTGRRGLTAHHDVTRVDRAEAHLFDRCAGAVTDEPAKRPAGLCAGGNGWRLSSLRRQRSAERNRTGGDPGDRGSAARDQRATLGDVGVPSTAFGAGDPWVNAPCG